MIKRIRHKDINLEHNRNNSIFASALVGDRLIARVFYYHNKWEARQLFYDEINSVKNIQEFAFGGF